MGHTICFIEAVLQSVSDVTRCQKSSRQVERGWDCRKLRYLGLRSLRSIMLPPVCSFTVVRITPDIRFVFLPVV